MTPALARLRRRGDRMKRGEFITLLGRKGLSLFSSASLAPVSFQRRANLTSAGETLSG
jgi:hypothetical protein